MNDFIHFVGGEADSMGGVIEGGQDQNSLIGAEADDILNDGGEDTGLNISDLINTGEREEEEEESSEEVKRKQIK